MAANTLVKVEIPSKSGQAGATAQTADAKGKVVEYSFWLLKQGYAESTIKGRAKLLKILVKRGANLLDPESVKETIAKQEWSEGRKVNAVDAYTCFLQMLGKSWEPPKYKRVRKLPFIPTENEVDQLIAGCGTKTATLLQLLKETGMRIGEAWKLHWTEIDFVSNIIRVTPEKGSNPRVFKVSNKLMSMLKALQEHSSSNRVFQKSLRSQARLFHKQRRKIASKLQNPRILSISFHTFRHWKATMEYHKTKDILHVMKVLGHKNINNTLVYTQLVDFGDDEYTVRVAHTIEEDKQLLEAGFEYITERDGYKIYRKRK
jgi:integrase